MRGKGGLAAAVAACLLVTLVSAQSAEAKRIRYSGETSQHHTIALRTNAKGKVQRIAIVFDAKCRKGRVDNGIQYFYAPFDKAGYRSFSDHAGFSQKFPESGTKGKFRVRVFGRRVSRERIRGTFDWKGKYFYKGKKYTACRIRTVHWSVSR